MPDFLLDLSRASLKCNGNCAAVHQACGDPRSQSRNDALGHGGSRRVYDVEMTSVSNQNIIVMPADQKNRWHDDIE